MMNSIQTYSTLLISIAIGLVVLFLFLFRMRMIWKLLAFAIILPLTWYVAYTYHWLWFLIVLCSFLAALLFSKIFKRNKKPALQDGEREITLRYTERNGKPQEGSIRFKTSSAFSFLVYAGADGGKTKSVAKPLLSEFMRNGESIFCYDAKENDYTNTAYQLQDEIGYEPTIYNINFADPSHGHRFNPIKATLIQEESYVQEYMTHFYVANSKSDRMTDWDNLALGLFRGVAFSMYKSFPKFFTFPHISNFIIHNDNDTIESFLSLHRESLGFASGFMDSKSSPKTRGSIKTTLSGVIGSFAANKKMCYVLSGDDFDFNLVDPRDRKSVFVSNNFDLRDQISPVVVMLFIIAMRAVRFGNTVPICAFMDEATTFKIPNFEEYPSELREYLVSFVFLTQSPAKIEKAYDSHSRSSIEANFLTQLTGRTQDDKALTNFENRSAKEEVFRKSITTANKSSRVSVTKSTSTQAKYDKEFYQNLKAGEFLGRSSQTDEKDFHVRFAEYQGHKLPQPPLVKRVTNDDLEEYYHQIILDVTQTIIKTNHNES